MRANKDHITDLLEKALIGRLDEEEQRMFEACLAADETTQREYETLKEIQGQLDRIRATFHTSGEVQSPAGLRNRILGKVRTKAIPACLDQIHQGLSGYGPVSIWMRGSLPEPIDLPDCGYRLVFDRRSMTVSAREYEVDIGFLVIRAEPQDGQQQLVGPDDLVDRNDESHDLKIVFYKVSGYYSIETESVRVVEGCVEWQIKESDIMYAPHDGFRLSLSSHDYADHHGDTETLARAAGATSDVIEYLTQIVPVDDEAVDEGYVCYCLMFEDTSDEEFDEYSDEILKQYRSTESQKVAGLRGLYLTMPLDTAKALHMAWKSKHSSTESLS